MAVKFDKGAEPSRPMLGGERFRLVMERVSQGVPLFWIERPDAILEAWQKIGQSQFVYGISPAPLSNSTTAAIDVKARQAAAGKSVGEMVTDVQRTLGVWVAVYQVTPLDYKELAPTIAALQRQQAAEQASAEGAGLRPEQKVVQQAEQALGSVGSALKRGVVWVLVIAGLGLVGFAVVRGRLAR